MLGKQTGNLTTEVLVVGAGPVGLFAALELAERGVAVEIIDGQWRTATRSYALALHPGSLELLGGRGLVDELLDHGHRIDRIAFFDGTERRAEIELSKLPGEFPFVVVLPQKALEDALEARLAAHNVQVRWSHRLAELSLDAPRPSETWVRARIDQLGKEAGGYAYSTSEWVTRKSLAARARFVIGADGLHSAVRRALAIDFPELRKRQFFGIFEFGADLEAADEVRVVLDDETTSVLWPMGDGRFRWSFELGDSWEFVPATRTKSRLAVQVGDDAFPFLNEDKLRELLAERAPWFDAEIGDIGWSVAVRFEHRLASSFGHGGAWLVGDAAHVTAPVGVQSMNVGLREAHGLVASIEAVLHAGASPLMLESYAMDRRAEWRTLFGLDGALCPLEGVSEWASKRSARIVPCLPGSGADLRRMLEQLRLEPGRQYPFGTSEPKAVSRRVEVT